MISNLSSLSLAILGLIGRSPRSGYELRTLFEQTPLGRFSSSPGAVYPALRRLKTAELLNNSDEVAPRRKVLFELTRRGSTELCAELRAPITDRDVERRFHHLMLRFAFMDGNVDTNSISRFLADLEERSQQHLLSITNHRIKPSSNATDANGFCANQALQHGVFVYRANLNWIRQAKSAHLDHLAKGGS